MTILNCGCDMTVDEPLTFKTKYGWDSRRTSPFILLQSAIFDAWEMVLVSIFPENVSSFPEYFSGFPYALSLLGQEQGGGSPGVIMVAPAKLHNMPEDYT